MRPYVVGYSGFEIVGVVSRWDAEIIHFVIEDDSVCLRSNETSKTVYDYAETL